MGKIKILRKAVSICLVCILALSVVGCGPSEIPKDQPKEQPSVASELAGEELSGGEPSEQPAVSTPEGTDAPAESIESEATDASADESGSFITVEEANAAALANAGLAEADVRFVRTHLDTENGAAGYEIEFISRDAEYDYRINAATGEILSMNCEAGAYEIDAVDTQDAAAGQPAGSAGAQETYIGSEAAKQAALSHAGLDAGEVRFVHAHLEYDDGYWKYDVEFHKDNTEYDYDIDAMTGEVLSFDHDAEYYQSGAAASTEAGQIGEEEARRIAFQHAGVAEEDVQRLEVKFDYDDGRAEYEVEWYIGRMEYSCDVDASTGEILSFKKEYDD